MNADVELEGVIKEIIENLGQLEHHIIPHLDFLLQIVKAHVGADCSLHGIIRDAILKSYYIAKVSYFL